jgi:ubiquinone/menaquinone biosynthesis C-methylase UbiE
VERSKKEGREVLDHRREIVAAAGLNPGPLVADIGAGTGLFTFLFADAVGAGGRLHAVDISPRLLAHLMGRAAEGGYLQVVTELGADQSARLDRSSVDRVFLCDTRHHFKFPQHRLVSIHDALTRDGELLLVEFKRIPGISSDWMMTHVHAGLEVFERETAGAGFEKVALKLCDKYVSRFRTVRR